MQTTLGHLPYLSARTHLIPSVAMPRSAFSTFMVLMRFSDASFRGWLAAVIAMTSPGTCSSSLYDRVTSVYPSVRTIGTTSTLDVRNWGLSCVLTLRLGGVAEPDMTMADVFLPRALSISATACSMVPMRSSSDASMPCRFPGPLMSVAGGGDRTAHRGFWRSGTCGGGSENP